MAFVHFNKKLFAIAILFIFLWLCFELIPSSHFTGILVYFYRADSIRCYRYQGETLPDISSVNVRNGKSIFFHETSCNSYYNGKIVIKPREACAVESAALLNPKLDVYLLFTSPGILKFQGTESDRILQALRNYDNVHIHHLNYEKFTKDTPLEQLYKNGTIENSYYPMSHASDILRYLTLWKYGGIYLDLDVVVIKNLETLPPNFAGCESDENVAAGIIAFEPNSTETKYRLAEECVMDLEHNFRGDLWGNNGPGVITRLVKKHCKNNKVKASFNKVCDNFHVFSPEAFYPIPWRNWRHYFEEKYLKIAKNITKNSYIIHVWNKHSISMQLPLDSKNIYVEFAKKYCPKVFAECDSYF